MVFEYLLGPMLGAGHRVVNTKEANEMILSMFAPWKSRWNMESI